MFVCLCSQLNDICAIESVAYLIKYDSVHGTWGPTVTAVGDKVVITDGNRTLAVQYTAHRTLQDVSLLCLF